jgi:hypothetical protein
MTELEVLEAEIKEKIESIRHTMSTSVIVETEVDNQTPEYLNLISNLQKENADLKAEQKSLRQEHLVDLDKIDDLLSQLSKLMEISNA